MIVICEREDDCRTRPCEDLNAEEGLEEVVLKEIHGSNKANLGDAHSLGLDKEIVMAGCHRRST